jgi:hypothetical protein
LDQLLAKLTNISYEVFGVFVPGVVLILFGIFGWWCLGPVAGFWSQGFLPTAELVAFSSFLNLLNEGVQVGMVFFVAIAAYFCGHLLHWLSRRGGREDKISDWKRVRTALIFRVSKPATNFHESLGSLFQEAKSLLGLMPDAEWREYYPIAKSYLALSLQSSLAPTYQTKYTLHRSITIAAVVWFWGTIVGILLSFIAIWLFNAASPKWIPLIGSLIASITLVWGFSGSYRYNWLLWGDTLISEVYMLKKVENDKLRHI